MRVKDLKGNRGIALLMSLTIILFVSVALMKTFENRSVEIAHLENTYQRFQAETLSRSVLRTILMTIKTQKLIVVMNGKDRWQDIPFPFEKGIFQINEIKSIDHHFNLNRDFKSGNESDIFSNMVVQYYESQANSNGIIKEDTSSVMSAINDWTDYDQEPDEVYLYDYEQYPQNDLNFEIKNRDFDRLSELKIIPPFQKLGFSVEYLNDHFRVKGKDESVIDINLATKEEMESFLERYKGIAGYYEVYDNRSQIAEIMDGADKNADGSQMTGLPSLDPRFALAANSRDESEWNKKLKEEGISLEKNGKQMELFAERSNYIRLKFSVQVDRTTINAESIIKIEYLKNTFNISGMSVLKYTLF